MKNHWIFIVKKEKFEDQIIEGIDIYKNLMKEKRWGFGERTANKKNLATNDKVVFYLAGVENPRFLGTAALGSEIYPLKSQLKSTFYDADFAIKIKNIEEWKQSKLAANLIKKLDFVKNKKNWGAYFQGGVRSIPVEDFTKIISYNPTKKDIVEDKLPKWKKFEEEVMRFLTKLGFADVNGGIETRKIFGLQVDACGGLNNVLLLIECKYSSTQKDFSLDDAINKIVTNRAKIKSLVKKDPIYSKYTNVEFIIATRNYLLKKNDLDKAKAHKIHIWNEQLIEYYKNLIKDIGKYTTFNLFGEMGINPPEEKLVRKPAIKIKIRNHILYSLFMNPEELLECSYVARRERGKTEFYQRVLRRQRLSNIAKEFIIKEKGMFPNNIIISLETGSKFIPIDQPQDLSKEIEFGILQFPKRYISCKIIDGQHRLYSFAKTHIHFPLPVTAFKNIKDLEEMKFFVDINEKQKSIDSNLIWDLYGDLHPGSPRGLISRCVKRINDVEPFFDKNNGIRNYNVYVPLKGGRKTGDISLSGLCDSIKKTGLTRKHTRTLKRNINTLFHKNDNTMISRVSINLSKYFSCIDKILSDDAKDFIFHIDGGMSVMIFLFEKLFARFKGKIEEDEIIKYIKSLKSFFDKEDIDEIKSRCTSEEQKGNVVNDFLYHLALDLDDESLEKFVKITKYDEDIKEFERKLGKFIKLILEKEDKDWIKHRVDGNTSKRSKIRFEGRIPEDPRKEIHEFFTLGEERSIIERNDNWSLFKKHFVNVKGENPDANKFHTANLFLDSLKFLSDYRNPPQHGAKIKLTREHASMIKSYLSKANSCIEKAIS